MRIGLLFETQDMTKLILGEDCQTKSGNHLCTYALSCTEFTYVESQHRTAKIGTDSPDEMRVYP